MITEEVVELTKSKLKSITNWDFTHKYIQKNVLDIEGNPGCNIRIRCFLKGLLTIIYIYPPDQKWKGLDVNRNHQRFNLNADESIEIFNLLDSKVKLLFTSF
jgi:hypothetical protein